MSEDTKKNEAIEGVFEEKGLVPSADLLSIQPVMMVEEARKQFRLMLSFANSVMVPGVEYGVVPGTSGSKPTLLKPGAEKLITFFGYDFDPELVEQKMEWETSPPLFYFRYRATLSRGGRKIVAGEGSANSFEKKYRWRWVRAHEIDPVLDRSVLMTQVVTDSIFAFQYDKRETTGRYGKSEAYWEAWDKAFEEKGVEDITKTTRGGEDRPGFLMTVSLYRVPNPEPFDLINTLQKMSQKRAMVSAALVGCYASSLFTQDIEDLGPGGLGGSRDAPTIDEPRVYSPPVQGGIEEAEVERPRKPLSPPATDADFWNFYFDVGAKFSKEEKTVARAVGEDVISEAEGDFDRAILALGDLAESGEIKVRLNAKIDQTAEADLLNDIYITLAAISYVEEKEVDLDDLVTKTGRGTKVKPVRLQTILDYEKTKDFVLRAKPDLEDVPVPVFEDEKKEEVGEV